MTIAVVAVLDINIEAIIVVNINPARIFFGVVPDIFSVNRKRSASRPVFVNAAARKNPPNNSQIMLLENVLTYLAMS